MTDHIAIRVENLSKLYRIGRARQRHDTLRDALVGTFKRFNVPTFQRSNVPTSEDDTLWALKDVSFEVQRGEVVGVIGRNGAGKSTLLKILSRITEPTSGRAEIHGRVGSLLEVGTGFHPELTGRENTYLSGAILGMRRVEIDRKFDEIVAFAEIEKFLDTPVKHYSSGMYVRLAFAVAAHLEPEILLVDEVLAVGDNAFQKKCLGKMEGVAKQGRTVLFVSHNMATIQALCQRVLVLENGLIDFYGLCDAGISHYLSTSSDRFNTGEPGIYDFSNRRNHYLPEHVIIKKMSIRNSSDEVTNYIKMGEGLSISIAVDNMVQYPNVQLAVMIKSKTGQWLVNFNTGMSIPIYEVPRKAYEVYTLSIPHIPLVPDTYWIELSVARKATGRIDYVERAAQLIIEDNDVYGTGYHSNSFDSIIYLQGQWKMSESYDSGS